MYSKMFPHMYTVKCLKMYLSKTASIQSFSFGMQHKHVVTISLTLVKLRHLGKKRPYSEESHVLHKKCIEYVYSLPFPTFRHFLMPLQQNTFENTVTKGEIAQNEQFLLLPQCFEII